MNWPGRFPLAVLPTPLVPALRLGAALERSVWIKRDDLTGFVFGGNKIRTLEMLIADALAQGCDHIVGSGGPGSNLCSALAAAAATSGLGCTLVLYGTSPAIAHLNLAVMRAVGAEVVFTDDPDRAATPLHAERIVAALRDKGRHPYCIARGAASGLGATAYVLAAVELASQLTFAPAHVVVPVGSGGTIAGLLVGWTALDLPGLLVGVAVSRPLEETAAEIHRLAGEAAGILGVDAPTGDRVRLLDGLGRGFGQVDETTCAAAHLALRTEGLVADATYVARAVATLGTLDGPIILWHTGGWLGFIGDVMGGRDS